MTKNAILNDLNAIDFALAEYFDENGVNPFPSACDGYDIDLAELDNAELAHDFSVAKINLDKVIALLGGERTFENEQAIDLVINNLRQKSELLLKEEPNFNNADYSFVELYTNLKRIQNSLGISIPAREVNIFAFFGEELDVEELKNKILSYVGRLGGFLKEGEISYQSFLNNNKEASQSKLKVSTKDKDIAKEENIVVKEKTLSKRTSIEKTL